MQIRLPTTCIRWISKTNPQLFESPLQSGNFWIRYEFRIAWMLNLDIFESVDVTKSSPVLYPEYCIQDGNFLPRFSLLPAFTTHALLPIGWIRLRVGYVWKGKFDLNTDTCGRRNHWIWKEKVVNSKNIRIRVDGASELYPWYWVGNL